MHHSQLTSSYAQGRVEVAGPYVSAHSIRAGLKEWSFWGIIFFLLAHIPLSFVIELYPTLAMFHALGALGLGLYWLLIKKDQLYLMALTAYIAGAEMLWRGKGGAIFWEYGKYAIGLLLLLSLVRYGKLRAAHKAPLFYSVLLLPSIAVMPYFDRQAIAFNLTGPFCLAVATMYFSTVSFTPQQVRSIFLALLAPIIGFASLASSYTLQLDPEVLAGATASIKETAAGVGPNQVSSVLGFAALAAFFLVFLERKSVPLRFFFVIVSLWLLSQGALTFSRGGVVTALGAVGVAAFYMIQNRRTRAIFMTVLTTSLFLTYVVILPFLEETTGGSIETRFKDFSTTGRDLIVMADIDTYFQYPLLGVGPNQSKQFHISYFRYSSAHTEYTRMLAEHGTFGLVSLLILLSMAFRRLRLKAPPLSKAFSVSLTIWALLFMLHAATRIALASFAFGLAAGSLLADENHKQQRD